MSLEDLSVVISVGSSRRIPRQMEEIILGRSTSKSIPAETFSEILAEILVGFPEGITGRTPKKSLEDSLLISLQFTAAILKKTFND